MVLWNKWWPAFTPTSQSSSPCKADLCNSLDLSDSITLCHNHAISINSSLSIIHPVFPLLFFLSSVRSKERNKLHKVKQTNHLQECVHVYRHTDTQDIVLCWKPEQDWFALKSRWVILNQSMCQNLADVWHFNLKPSKLFTMSDWRQ